MSRSALHSFVLASIGVVAACTHRKVLNDARALAGASVRFETQHGVEEHGHVVETEGGVVIRGERGDFELREVVEITRVRRLRGAVEGLGLGILVGALGGAGLGYASGCERTTASCFTKGDSAAVGAIVGGALGIPLGLLVGSLIGSRDVYSINTTLQSRSRFVPAGPAGSAIGATVRF